MGEIEVDTASRLVIRLTLERLNLRFDTHLFPKTEFSLLPDWRTCCHVQAQSPDWTSS